MNAAATREEIQADGGFKTFQSSAAREGGCYLREADVPLFVSRFQSSAADKSGCYVVLHDWEIVVEVVSILSRPGRRLLLRAAVADVLVADVSILSRP